MPIPINRTTINALYGLSLSTDDEAQAFLQSRAEPIGVIETSEDVVVSAVGRELYEKFFRGYTRKQWGLFTGPIDEYFDYRHGKLPCRSLRFEHETIACEQLQRVAVVNYPDEAVPYTRITEYKHLTGQEAAVTSITREYPAAEGDPYYPIPRPENQALFKRYEALAMAEPDVTFVGRLATYRYYNMDQIVGQALATFRRRFESNVPAGREVEKRMASGG